MEFEQKAEEKKMSMSKNIARLAVTAGLTAALSFGGVMAPVTMAFAAEGATTTTNTITISNIGDNKDVKYKAYQIFKATVTDTENGGKTAQNITWADNALGETVVNAIKSTWTGYEKLTDDEKLSGSPTPQEVADFLVAHAGPTTAGSTSTDGTRIDTGNILYAVANAVKDKVPTESNITAGQPWTATAGSGYYLFVTSDLDPNKPNTGTSPIFAIVGGEPVTVAEKTSIPTVEKKILDDSKVKGADITSETGWVDAADFHNEQEVNYRLTGTIADNYASYDSYSYTFTDTLTKGLYYDYEQPKVYAVNKDSNNGDKYTDISEYFDRDVSQNNTILTVKAKVGKQHKYLKEIPDSVVNANTKIVVFYKAKLNSNAVIAGANDVLKGNPNTVTLEYSNNPMSGGTGTSESDTVEAYTYGIRINKVDLGTEAALDDATFTIQATGADDGTSRNLYVQENGSLGEYKHEFKTRNGGVIKVTGLDAGVYTVTETSAPSGYTKVDPFTFEIKPTMTADGPKAGLTRLDGVLTTDQDGKVIAGITDKDAGDNTLTAKPDSDKDADGTFNITVGDTKQVDLPLTGLNGVTFTWIAGGAVLCIGVAHLIRSRKQAEESEQE